jgi:hypothetical protein
MPTFVRNKKDKILQSNTAPPPPTHNPKKKIKKDELLDTVPEFSA